MNGEDLIKFEDDYPMQQIHPFGYVPVNCDKCGRVLDIINDVSIIITRNYHILWEPEWNVLELTCDCGWFWFTRTFDNTEPIKEIHVQR